MNRIKENDPRGLPFYYWLIGGLVAGIFIGWFFHGFINMLLRIALVGGLVIVGVLIVYLWRKSTSPSRSRESDIPEGAWRDIDASGRN